MSQAPTAQVRYIGPGAGADSPEDEQSLAVPSAAFSTVSSNVSSGVPSAAPPARSPAPAQPPAATGPAAASRELDSTPARPRVHFTPQQHWMNDPNGLVFHDGRYHLFFQYNPYAAEHGDMSWGHASSPDLFTWTEHPVALWHDDVNDVFSGCVVIDEENTAGFAVPEEGPGDPALVAIFTAARRDRSGQAQALAISTDGAATWQHYEANPVLDLGTKDFRDPKVFRYSSPTRTWWVMVAVEADRARVVFYSSTDLKTWTYLSSYWAAGAVGGMWECPDLFPLQVQNDPGRTVWVLLISICPGGVAGGSGTQYVLGDFDGHTFTPLDPLPPLSSARSDLERAQWLDWGRDCYAGVTFAGLPAHERVLLAWMNNWDYATKAPTSPWRGAMTVPRRLGVREMAGQLRLVQTPVLPAAGPGAERRDDVRSDAQGGQVQLPVAAAVHVRASLARGGVLTVRIAGDDGRGHLDITYDAAEERLMLDRRFAGDFDPSFASVESAPCQLRHGELDLTIVVDSTSVEVFAGFGETVITDLAFLAEHKVLTVPAASGSGATVVESLRVVDLAPTPDPPELSQA